MVGEIRDLETAHIAIQATLTGHLVFATLTPTTPRARSRGCSTWAWSHPARVHRARRARPTPRAQDLPDCRKPGVLSAAERDAVPAHLHGRPVYTAAGCPQCKGSGYRGRSGIYELLTVDEEMRRLIHDAAAESALRERAIARGMMMLRDDGLRWVERGETTVAEVLRVSRAADE